MHRTALQTLARASLRPSVVVQCTCAQPIASTSIASKLVQQRRLVATAASGRRAIASTGSASWKRWQSTSSAASSPPAAGFKTSYPTSSSSSTISASRPRQRTVNTSLPQIKDQRLMYAGVAAFAVTAWTFFVMWAMSAEKASSSVVRTLAFNLRSSPIVKEALGEGVKLKPFLWSDNAWVHGKVNTIQGIVDINFRVFAANGREGTVYFKSERRHRAGRFETVHFRLQVDGRPEPIDLKNADLLQLDG